MERSGRPTPDAAQPAHPADAARGERDRADFGARISYIAITIHLGGAADGQSVSLQPIKAVLVYLSVQGRLIFTIFTI